MAVFPNVPSVVKITIQGLTQQQPYVNGFYVKYAGTRPPPEQLDPIASTFATAYWNSFGPVLNTATHQVQATAIDLTDRNALLGLDSTAHVGTHPGTAVVSVQIACCVSFSIANRYRGGHPRMYLPGADNQDIQLGHLWTDTARIAYENAADAFMTAVNGALVAGLSWTFVAVRTQGLGVTPGGSMVLPVIATKVRTRVDSMRRRLGKEPS